MKIYKKLSYLLAVLITVSCNTASQTDGASKLQPQLAGKPKVKLPLKGICNVNETSPDSLIGFTGLPDDVKYGKLIKVMPDYAVMLLLNTQADYQLHYLATVSDKGEVIDTLELFGISCSEDNNYYGGASYVIDKDLSITLKDTSASYQRNQDGEILKESIKSESHIFKFKIDNQGKINESK